MAERKYFSTEVFGGMDVSESPFHIKPNKAYLLKNFQPDSIFGGYQVTPGSAYTTISGGYVDGQANPLLGIFIMSDQWIILASSDSIKALATPSHPTGSLGSYTTITSNTRTSAGKYTFIEHNLPGYAANLHTVVGCDGVNYPFSWNNTDGYTLINGSASVQGAHSVEFHKNHVFYATDTTIIVTAPNTDNNFSAIDGASEIVVPDRIIGLKAFRDILIIFCGSSIYKLLGDNSQNFELELLNGKIGCLSRFTIQEMGGDIVFLAPDGIRGIRTTEVYGDIALSTLSEPLIPLFNGIQNQSSTFSFASLVVRSRNQYYLFWDTNISFTTAKESSGNFRGILGSPIVSGGAKHEQISSDSISTSNIQYAWSLLSDFDVYSAHSNYVDGREYMYVGSSQSGDLLSFGIMGGSTGFSAFGSVTGNQYRIATPTSSNNTVYTNLNWLFMSPYISLGNNFSRKTLKRLTFLVSSDSGDFTLETRIDGNSIIYTRPSDIVKNPDWGGVGATEKFMLIYNLEGSCNNVQFILSGTLATNATPLNIWGYEIEYIEHKGNRTSDT